MASVMAVYLIEPIAATAPAIKLAYRALLSQHKVFPSRQNCPGITLLQPAPGRQHVRNKGAGSMGRDAEGMTQRCTWRGMGGSDWEVYMERDGKVLLKDGDGVTKRCIWGWIARGWLRYVYGEVLLVTNNTPRMARVWLRGIYGEGRGGCDGEEVYMGRDRRRWPRGVYGERWGMVIKMCICGEMGKGDQEVYMERNGEMWSRGIYRERWGRVIKRYIWGEMGKSDPEVYMTRDREEWSRGVYGERWGWVIKRCILVGIGRG